MLKGRPIKKGEHIGIATEFKKGLIPWNKGKKGFIPWNKGKKGFIPWNKGKKGFIPWNKGKKLHYPVWNKGKHYKTGKPSGMKGKHFSEKAREKMSLAHRGEKSYLWKGGISKLNIYRHYNNFEYRNWREKVFARDSWTCLNCGISGVFLHPHHIKSYTYYPEDRYDVENGITLCVPCHHQLHFGN